MKKIIVLTSGGDAPGMNAAIRSVVRTAIYHGMAVFGSCSGYQGIVEKQLKPLKAHSVANCIQQGGTILKADRCKAFYDKNTRDECRAFLQQENIDGIVVIGGDGSFRGATLLNQEGGPAVVGVPATIDNDINGTEYTLGFDTARNTALDAIDRIRDTASSHNRHFLVEVMGRNSGFLAVDVGIAGGAEYILIPEFDKTPSELVKHLDKQSRKKQSSIIVVAESDNPGRSFALAEQLNELTHKTYRVCVLGHTQRGGKPTAIDRKFASTMGTKAVLALKDGETAKMVAFNSGHLELKNFPDPSIPSRQFKNGSLLKINEMICS